jgi:hypothetical protein
MYNNITLNIITCVTTLQCTVLKDKAFDRNPKSSSVCGISRAIRQLVRLKQVHPRGLYLAMQPPAQGAWLHRAEQTFCGFLVPYYKYQDVLRNSIQRSLSTT